MKHRKRKFGLREHLLPVPSVGIRGVQIFDEIVSFADEEVVSEHDADETAHEDTHSGDAGEEDGAGDEHFPGDHAPAADEATDDLATNDVDVLRGHGSRVHSERDQICDEVRTDLADHEGKSH